VRQRNGVEASGIRGEAEGVMVNRAAYKGEKRQKELARLKKQEEKRQRRLERKSGDQKDEDIVDASEYLDSDGADENGEGEEEESEPSNP
jgi:hypothetical protein